MRSFWGVASFSFALAIGVTGTVAAQVPVPPVPSQQAVAPPDLVRLNDGGMVRGTIVESVPGQYVVISLTTGETRRIEWSSVAYAGPASGTPATASGVGVATPATASGVGVATPIAQPAVPVMVAQPAAPAGVQLRFEAEQPNLTFHRVTGSAQAIGWGYGGTAQIRAFSFERLCAAPCELALAPGNYHLALSAGNGDAVPAQVVDITRPGTLRGRYDDRNGMRIAGFLTIGLGAAGGAALMLAPLAFVDFGRDDFIDAWLPWLIAGGSVLLVAEIVGLILAMQGDVAEIRFD